MSLTNLLGFNIILTYIISQWWCMNKSDDISQLALALSKLQGEIKDAYKDRKGYGYQYADLSSVLDIIRPLSSKYRLSITQLPGAVGEKVSLETVLMHESGQWISSIIEMPVQVGKGMSMAQATGAVLTYARRYALAAIFGIAQTDNDAAISEPSVSIVKSNLFQSFTSLIKEMNVPDDVVCKWLDKAGVSSAEELPENVLEKLISIMNTKKSLEGKDNV